jgi:hypothetical protein
MTLPRPRDIVIGALLVAVILLQVLILLRMQPIAVHTVVLNWFPVPVAAHNLTGYIVSGYVANWTWARNVRITSVQVWMGNPAGISWEGDVYITLNNRGDFTSPDQVITHYQFDKHAETSAPHQLFFQLGSKDSGCFVSAGQTTWVWRAFVNISDTEINSADGQVILYYVEAG